MSEKQLMAYPLVVLQTAAKELIDHATKETLSQWLARCHEKDFEVLIESLNQWDALIDTSGEQENILGEDTRKSYLTVIKGGKKGLTK